MLPALAVAQDDRRDYPSWIGRGTVEFGIGDIGYLFSQQQLEPGYRVESVHVPDLAARLVLGHRFNDRLSAQLSYLRPARWVQYRNINGDSRSHSVWMNVAGFSLRRNVAVAPRVSIYGEGGVGVVTRHGVEIEDTTVVKDVVTPTPLLGVGAEYRLSREWGVVAGATFLPGRKSHRQPATAFASAAVAYHVAPRTPPAIDDQQDRPVFHEHLIQVGVTTTALGHRFNTVMSPVFWEGDVGVKNGVAVSYQRNVFHTRKLFSIDLGADVAYGQSRLDGDRFMTLSVFPVMRFTIARTSAASVYFSYSLAGPTFISKYIIDGHETGRHFTMRDSLGFGAYIGKGHHMNAELRIGHFSNGNLLPRNTGIQIPATVTFGYAF